MRSMKGKSIVHNISNFIGKQAIKHADTNDSICVIILFDEPQMPKELLEYKICELNE